MPSRSWMTQSLGVMRVRQLMSGLRKILEEVVEVPEARQGGRPLGAGAEVTGVEVAGVGVGAGVGAGAEANQGGRGVIQEIRQDILQLGDARVDAPAGPGLSREQRAHPRTGEVPILRLNPSHDRGHRRRILFYNEAVLSNESPPSIWLYSTFLTDLAVTNNLGLSFTVHRRHPQQDAYYCILLSRSLK